LPAPSSGSRSGGGVWLAGLTVGLAEVPRSYEVRFDSNVFLFILGLALVLGLVIGAVPSMQPQA
jgi:hypothetical protein